MCLTGMVKEPSRGGRASHQSLVNFLLCSLLLVELMYLCRKILCIESFLGIEVK